MQNPRLAIRYAKSLLDLAIEQNSVEDTLSDVQLLHAICSQSSEFVNVLRSPIIHADKKQSILDAVMGSKLHTLTEAFIRLLINKGREANLPEIATTFISQYKELKNIKIAKLSSAVPFNDTLKDAIKAKVLSNMPGMKIELKEEINPDLIGGFVLQIDDKLFDASIRRDLNDVRAQFRKNIYVSELR